MPFLPPLFFTAFFLRLCPLFRFFSLWALCALLAGLCGLCPLPEQAWAAGTGMRAGGAVDPVYGGGRRLAPPGGDALPDAPLTMPEAVDRALRFNPGLGAQEAQSRSSESGRKAARSAFGPKLGTSYSVARQERESSSPVAAKPPSRGVYSWGVEVSQPVFQGFRLLASYQKAALQADSDKAALRKAELDMTQKVQTQFLNCLRYDEDVRSKRDALARLQDQLRITTAFHKVGLRPRLDVLQAEVDVREAEQALIQAETSRDTSLSALNILLGLPASARVKYVGTLRHVPFSRSLEQCLEAAWRQRPDLYMAAKSVEIAGKSRQVVQSGYYPQVEAYYNVTESGNTPDLKKAGKNGSHSVTWEAGARLTWDVFQWGTTYHADREAGWLVTKMRHEEANLRLTVGHDVKSCLLALREAEKRIRVAEKSVEQASEAYAAALARYQERVGTNFEVLDASSKLTSSQAALTSARSDYLTSLSRMYVVMGEFHPNLLRH